MAAGRGERMRPLSDKTPKPLLPSADRCLLGQQIDFIRPFVKNLHVTVGHLANQVATYAKGHDVDNIVDIQQGGNASWIKFAEFNQIETSTLVITSDNLMQLDLNVLFTESQVDINRSLIVPVIAENNEPGDRILLEGKQVAIITPRKVSNLLASGLQVINPSIAFLSSIDGDDFSQIWNGLISNQQLLISELRPSSWFAIDTPEDLEIWSLASKNTFLNGPR